MPWTRKPFTGTTRAEVDKYQEEEREAMQKFVEPLLDDGVHDDEIGWRYIESRPEFIEAIIQVQSLENDLRLMLNGGDSGIVEDAEIEARIKMIIEIASARIRGT